MSHKVAITVAGKHVLGFTSYEIENDMLEPADGFSLSLAPFSRELWELCRPDREIQVLLDDTPVLLGFLGERQKTTTREGSEITVSGMDKAGRLLRESMDLVGFRRMTLHDLVARCVYPWFDTVVFSNARNRDLVRGRGASKAKAFAEPLLANQADAPKRVEPGQTRWETMAQFLERSDLLLWSSADGKEFVVGKPNYAQESQYRFVLSGPEANVVRSQVKDSVEERYSQVTCVGAAKGDSMNYGRRLLSAQGHAVNGDGPYGTGRDFAHRKVLILSDDGVRGPGDAKARAQAEMALRDATGHVVELTVRGHSQLREPSKPPALYAFDTMADVEDPETGHTGRYLVTRVRFQKSRSTGPVTDLELVAAGTRLAL
jgi:prophage tail gpP-like protein